MSIQAAASGFPQHSMSTKVSIASIEPKLNSLNSQLEDLDKQQERLREALASQKKTIEMHIEQVEQRKKAIHEEIFALHARFAPIGRIPLDIFGEIARLSLPRYPSPFSHHAPLSFSQVSQAWRSVTLLSPSLWTTLFLRIIKAESFPKNLEIIQEWFKRAKGLPLSFFLYFDFPVQDHVDDLKKFLIDITPFIARARHLGLGSAWMSAILSYLHGDSCPWELQILERFDLIHFDPAGVVPRFGSINVNTYPPLKLLTRAPLLRSWATDLLPSPTSILSTVQRSQLRNVTLSCGLSSTEWFRFLQECPQLDVGSFVVYAGNVAPPGIHPNLRSLTLNSGSDPSPSFRLLQAIEFPRLQALAIKTTGDSTNSWGAHILPGPIFCLSTVSCLILSGKHWDFTQEYMRRVLTEAANVRELVMTTCPYGFEILRNGLLVRLETLRFNEAGKLLVINKRSIENMIASRKCQAPQSTRVPLKRLILSSGAQIHPDFHSLRQYQSDNFEVKIREHDGATLARESANFAFLGWKPAQWVYQVSLMKPSKSVR